MGEQVKVAIVGLGARGKDVYAKFARLFPEKMKIVACADIIPEKVEMVKKDYGIEDEFCFASAEELLEKEKLADVLFVCTQDKQHYGHAIKALEKGYHLLLEKPISPSLEECKAIQEKAHECNRNVVVCHVLRYTVFYQTIKKIIDSGRIGKIVSLDQIENVCWWHQAHSFVRGNWRDANETSPMILAKSCHDMDIINWLMGKKCQRVSSFGNLYLFKEENAPEGSANRCYDGCKVKADCPYDVEKIYLDSAFGARHNPAWPTDVIAFDSSEESVIKALKEGPYGRCVYKCDNNVVDHQVVAMEFEDKSTATFTMCAFTSQGGRELKIMGTKGDIVANMETNTIVVNEFFKGKEEYDVSKMTDDLSGHGGGDNKMVDELCKLIKSGSTVGTNLTSIDISIQSHVMSLAAEYSRQNEGKTINLEEFENFKNK